MSTLRLIYPQWQGGLITALVPELDPTAATLGYSLGAQILDLLAPVNPEYQRAVVPISMEDASRRTPVNGISNWPALEQQTKAALELIAQANPERIITLGGECAVSVAPFAWLAHKYGPKTALVWIDAHPDINRPGDRYSGYHAMAVAALLGRCSAEVSALLPATFSTEQVNLVGLRSWDVGMQERQKEWGLKQVTQQELSENPHIVTAWLKDIGAEHVVIHFDLDALDPSDLFVAVGNEPNGLKVDQVVALINEIGQSSHIVGLTIAEFMPRRAIRLQQMMSKIKVLIE